MIDEGEGPTAFPLFFVLISATSKVAHIIDQLIWWACMLAEILLVVRSIPELFRRFPAFYCYLSCVLVSDLFAIPIYRNLPGFYGSFYWSSTMLTAILGYLVILEIYGRSLARFPGVARFIRVGLVGLLFLVAARAFVELFGGAANPLASSAALLERDLRTLQAILLGVFLGIVSFYHIPIGKNLRGIIVGYTLYVGVRVVELTAYTQSGKTVGIFVSKMEPVIYLICLGLWTLALWSQAPEPIVDTVPSIEQNYDLLLHQTRTQLSRAFAFLTRTVRP
ncbi:MAG TPA: hypothetical protein VN785_03745 [Candidatus Angelobacter sp.]|nr:hypothetical protein [Candidatus Angelobacter sp.]